MLYVSRDFGDAIRVKVWSGKPALMPSKIYRSRGVRLLSISYFDDDEGVENELGFPLAPGECVPLVKGEGQ